MTLLKSFSLQTKRKCVTSGVHFSAMFPKLSGRSMKKHMSITSLLGEGSGPIACHNLCFLLYLIIKHNLIRICHMCWTAQGYGTTLIFELIKDNYRHLFLFQKEWKKFFPCKLTTPADQIGTPQNEWEKFLPCKLMISRRSH